MRTRLRGVLAIAGREVRTTYLSPFGVGCTAAFAALAGVVLVIALRANQARLDTWFAPLYVALGLLACLLTTRSFAEEERSGGLELLLTAPVTPGQVVAGKLLGTAVVVGVVGASTAACPILVAHLGRPDAGPIVTGYVGLAVMGLAFVAVGLAVSAATANPLVAAAGSVAVLVALWLAGVIAGGLRGMPQFILQYVSPTQHVTGFLRGTLSVTDLTYFGSLVLAGVGGAVVVLRERR
ncbi:MAG TPA: ABC transporter permease subunit [Acidimicrobiales bacterium]